jgi:hypothetical protein
MKNSGYNAQPVRLAYLENLFDILGNNVSVK